MVKYEYRPDLEVFRRVDNRGPSLRVNIIEMRRIKSMMDLGIKAPTIMKKIDFVNGISMTTLRTIMNNIEEGNIDMEGDYPAPSIIVRDMDLEARVGRLERDVEEFKQRMRNDECTCNIDYNHDVAVDSFTEKIKRRIGL